MGGLEGPPRPPDARRRPGKAGAPLDFPRAVPALLEIRDLHVSYGRIRALQGVSLTVPEAGIVALIGANGAGKSTLAAGHLGHRARAARARSASSARSSSDCRSIRSSAGA